MTAGYTYTTRDAMRPSKLDQFTGQDDVTRRLSILLESAKGRGQLPDHILLAGPPGLGKTTLAHVIANELELPMTTAVGPSLEKPADIVSLLRSRTGPGVVFIDEIHRMGRPAEEMLYPAMEDGVLPIQLGEGRTAEQVLLEVPPFVLVGATTQVGLLAPPLRDRFGVHSRLRPYSLDDLTQIVQQNAGKLGLVINDRSAGVIASRSRGTPRVANQLLSRVRDVAQVENKPALDEEEVAAALDSFGVDELGVDEVGRLILEKLCKVFGGGPVGLSSLASAAGETPDSVEQVHEPHLLETGLMRRTTQGRVATAAGFEHIQAPVPPLWSY